MRTEAGGARAPRGRRAKIWLAAGAVLVAGTGAVVALRAGSDTNSTADGPHVVHTSVDSLDLTGSSGERVLAARSTKAFRMLAVSWQDPSVRLDGTVRVRTRSSATGKWSGWQALGAGDAQPDPAERDRAGVRGGTAPLWAGPSDGVQVKADGKTLPKGLTVDLVDPGKGGSTTPAMDPAAYAMPGDGEETPTDQPTGPETASTPEQTPSDSPAETTPAPADSATETPAESTPPPTPTAEPSQSTDAGTTAPASPSASASTAPPTSASPTAPGYLPSLSAAYPSCASASAVPHTVPNPPPAQPPATKVPAPPFVTRAGWGADECARDTGYPDYGHTVKAVFVHHTDTTNTYSCADSPSIVRSLYALHLHQGWRDLGYNFLVDKCGTIFEGRFGGAAMPVIGAQTYGFNTDSMGIAAIGTYTDLSGGDSTASTIVGATPSQAMVTAISRIAAWKLGMSGVSPTGTSTLTEGAKDSSGFTFGKTYTMNAVSGHRNGFATDCPGNQLYARLGTVRSYAAGPPAGLGVTSVDSASGTVRSGTGYVTGTTATVRWSTSTPAALLSGAEVLVDGTSVAKAAGTATSASVTLASGRHTVQVRATHVSGKTATSAAVTVTADTTRPTYPTALAAQLGKGTVNTAGVPVTVTWKAADDNGLRSQAATSPTAKALTATSTSWSTTAKSATATKFALTATDLAGNTASASVTRTATLVQESSAKATGTWTKRSSSSYLGGYSASSGTTNASLTWTFKGRSVAWIASRASTSGAVKIYVDGTYQATVDLKSATTAYRQAMWTKTWSSAAQHTLKIVVVGTSGRPTVTTDGIAVLN
ncbi:peptidoglycan recognition protein family protein [Streptomyces griseoluteus]|uniref:peptidoglycan recognition protein family protein n=1 Tax=Streptomyces griseoluteus TaxID=29306 RepID=UPI00380ED1F0